MYYFPRHSVGLSDWQVASDRRLAFSFALSAVLVAAILSMAKLPDVILPAPLPELVVDIVQSEEQAVEVVPEIQLQQKSVEQIAVPATGTAPAEPPVAEVSNQADETRLDVAEDLAVDVEPLERRVVDWEAEKLKGVQYAVDELERTSSVNPNFDKKRRRAAETFRLSQAPVEKLIWENVEKDQIGRTILRHGGCYRVLDDPRVTNRWWFKNFGQYMVFCDRFDENYLIEFDEVTDRYFYLDKAAARR